MTKRRLVIFTTITLAILVLGFLLNSFFNGSKKELAKTHQAVLEYVTNEKGYHSSDIQEIRTHSAGRMNKGMHIWPLSLLSTNLTLNMSFFTMQKRGSEKEVSIE
ncbi:hypothetical protein [Sporosarcina sp. Te-1]|uniref:hypothetical protein n=1 Tax=Sporosarcina sp. Te-1 TaxID=2818390 RepID=UPI001A9E955E|nr:hypothetical protein [Sporosarcina sp. Te-1]QTD39714.1 hypothetical protein J3U78_12795 [Sporosarcina sp. Te-1]